MGEFIPLRRLRQRDPFSPFLFILCMDILSQLLEAKKKVKGIKISREAFVVNHLMYADDLLLVGRASLENATAMWDCLELFCTWFRYKVNKGKSSILYSPNTGRIIKRKVKDLWGLRKLKDNTIYLGNSLIQSRNQTREFAKLRDRIQRRLEGWQSKLLSKAGKETLIKSVAQAIPIYSLSTFRVPKSVCDSLDSIVRRFWWGAKTGSNRFMALKSWRQSVKQSWKEVWGS